MTGRPSKTTVEYFPHYTTSGKTIFTLQAMYGNDGYAAWFKILEILGLSPGHSYEYSSPADWLYLVSKLGVSGEKTTEILQTLSDLGAIDHDLHTVKVLWSENFVDGLRPVYDKRSTKIPSKPTFRRENTETPGVSGEKTPQSKVKESKVKEELPLVIYSERFEEFWREYPKKKGKAKAFSFWEKYKCGNGIFEEVMASLLEHKASKDWIKDGGQYIPHCSTWVNGRGWEDEVEPMSDAAVIGKQPATTKGKHALALLRKMK